MPGVGPHLLGHAARALGRLARPQACQHAARGAVEVPGLDHDQGVLELQQAVDAQLERHRQKDGAARIGQLAPPGRRLSL